MPVSIKSKPNPLLRPDFVACLKKHSYEIKDYDEEQIFSDIKWTIQSLEVAASTRKKFKVTRGCARLVLLAQQLSYMKGTECL